MKHWPGKPMPLGATCYDKYTQFAVFSRHAKAVRLQFFNKSDDRAAAWEINLDPEHCRTGDIWHVAVRGIKPGQLYGYRMDGPYEPEKGHRFNRHKLLVDPYARAVTGNFDWSLSDAKGYDADSATGDLSFSDMDSAGGAPKCIVIRDDFRWGEDRHPRIPMTETVIYETHVKGFTCHPSSKVRHRGTFQGVIEKIPYLKKLGVTAVELMPIHEFDENEIIRGNPLTGEKT